jgi:hypothetical protein
LTKMMRVDPQDREDIDFLLRQPDLDRERLKTAVDCAVIPPVPEIEAAFQRNKEWLSKQM